MTDNDIYLIAATHGLWQVMESEESTKLLSDNNIVCGKLGAKALVEKGLQKWEERWTGENTTAICIMLTQKWRTTEVCPKAPPTDQ